MGSSRGERQAVPNRNASVSGRGGSGAGPSSDPRRQLETHDGQSRSRGKSRSVSKIRALLALFSYANIFVEHCRFETNQGTDEEDS